MQDGGKYCVTGTSQHHRHAAQLLQAELDAKQEQTQQQTQLSMEQLIPLAERRAYKLKEVQLKTVLHVLMHARGMIQFEQMEQFVMGLPIDSTALPRKHWGDDAGWEFAMAFDKVRICITARC